jgi:hypothetical protein
MKRELEVRKVVNVGLLIDWRRSNMEIVIGKYKISADKYNFMLEEQITPKRKRTADGGQPYWVTISYHPTIEGACSKLMQHNIKKKDCNSLVAVIDSIAETKQEIVDVLKSVSELPKIRGDK